ncbi:Hypothetical predicted protein [Mytilus galloprovincialis]|uniref:Uncharacterized protein n=1 Tax=Mytilus galloprovincialis TaxID=29158 RepID=A0A8B6E977_MYTGA|nr:Hypothetical predicted protein [Mytilus galloprovincialis]
MAASKTLDQNKTMDLSQVISEAHESLHENISPTAAVSFAEPNSQHFSKSTFQRPPVPPYPLQSTPIHEPQRISQSPMPCPQIAPCNSGLPISTATIPINSDPNVAIQMIFFKHDGIKEQDNESKEDNESVIKHLIATELEIRDANTIDFQNVHRLRPRNNGKPRNIIARFSQYDDHQRVLRAVPEN